MTLVGTSKKMLASEPRELGDRRRKMREVMERAQDGMSVLGHHQGEMTMAMTKTTTVLVDGREMDMSTASPMALSTDDSMEERKKEWKSWMLETRSKGSIMNYGVTPSELPSLLPLNWTDGWTRRMRHEGSGLRSHARRTRGYLDTGVFPFLLADHCDTMNY